MKISVSGTHSTGKSTILQLAEKSSYFRNYIFLPGITRMAKSNGFQINEQGTDETQLFIASYDIQNILGYPNNDTISDRCLLDTLVYSIYLHKRGLVTEDTLKILDKLWLRFQYYFDLIFYIEPEFEIVEDGLRSVNQEFQKEVKDIFDGFILGLEAIQPDVFDRFPKVCRLTGTPQQRLSQMKAKLEQLHGK